MGQHSDPKHHYTGDLDRLLSGSTTENPMALYHHDQTRTSIATGRLQDGLLSSRPNDYNSATSTSQSSEPRRHADNLSTFKTEELFDGRVQMQPQPQVSLSRADTHDATTEILPSRRAASKRNYVGMTTDVSEEDEDANLDGASDSNDDEEDPDSMPNYHHKNTSTGHRVLSKPFNKKNLKRHSETRFLLNQFGQNPHPDATQRAMLAKQIHGLSARQIQVWFQNRRAKLKRMSAADADRMLSTRSYPDGYGPQGFGASMSMTPCGPANEAYGPHVAEMFPAGVRDFDNRNVYARNAPQLMGQYTPHARAPDLPVRHGMPFDASPLRNQSGFRAYTQYGTSLGNDYTLHEDLARQHGCSPANATQLSSPSPYEQNECRNNDSPSNTAELSMRGHGQSGQVQYPRSVPTGEGYLVYPSPPGQRQIDMMESAETPDQYKYHHGNGELSYSLSDTDMHETYRLHQSRQADFQPYQGTYYTPVHGPRMVANSVLPYPHQQYMNSSGLGARRVTHETRYASPDTSMPEDAHYYYGSEEHIKHEQNECKDAMQLQDGTQSDAGSHCSREQVETADAPDLDLQEQRT